MISLLTLLLCLCFIQSQAVFVNSNGWIISADVDKEKLSISHEKLNVLLSDVRLGLNTDNSIVYCSDWKTKTNKTGLSITAKQPETVTWNFLFTDSLLVVKCSHEQGVLKGLAPAGEKRIPARMEEQDNDILYTSLGQVSANNIYCLFDRETGTMVKFPEQSELKRNSDDLNQMEITLPVGNSAAIGLIPDYYINVLGLAYYRPKREVFKTAPVAWSSWYNYYFSTTEQDMIRETDVLAKHLRPYGLEYVKLDACYTRGTEFNYLNWNTEYFPNGGKYLFKYIQDKGLKPGMWLNMYGSNYENAEMANKYPENYYQRDKDGSLGWPCCSIDSTLARLDYSNPEVFEKHLKPMFRTLIDDWGLKYLKAGGWGTYINYFNENKADAFDSTKTGREVYMEVQRAMREVAGDDLYVGGCAMQEVGLGFEVFDGSRIGGDVKARWYRDEINDQSMQIFFHSLFGANYLNNIVWHCDPDAVLLRNPLTLEEVRTIVSAIGLTGQLYMASDFMDKLPKRKLELYQKTIPTTPIVPIDLYPYKIKSNKVDRAGNYQGVVWSRPFVREFPRAIDLKVNSVAGIYDVVSVFNWKDESAVEEIQFSDDLGLDTDLEYLVFDFWNQKLEGIFTNKIATSIPTHGTRVFVIKPVANVPRFLSTSRYITSTVSLKELSWDNGQRKMSGTSEIVKGDDYSLFFHVPIDFEVNDVSADTEVLYHKLTGNLLEVKLSGNVDEEGDNATIAWSVQF